MANRDPEPESDREDYSPEYLKKRRADEPLAAAPPEPEPEPEEEDKDKPHVSHHVAGSEPSTVGQMLDAQEAEAAAKREADRRSALTQEERDAEDRAKAA